MIASGHATTRKAARPRRPSRSGEATPFSVVPDRRLWRSQRRRPATPLARADNG